MILNDLLYFHLLFKVIDRQLDGGEGSDPPQHPQHIDKQKRTEKT